MDIVIKVCENAFIDAVVDEGKAEYLEAITEALALKKVQAQTVAAKGEGKGKGGEGGDVTMSVV